MRFLVWIVVNVLALGAATALFSGITLDGADLTERILALIVVGAIFGVINSFIKPIVKLLALPFIILTLGLLLLVINAVALLATSSIADAVGVSFHVAGFGTAVLGSIVISLVSWGLSGVFEVDERR